MKLSEIATPQFNTERWLDSMKIKNYVIRPDGTVDVNGHVDLHDYTSIELPVQFGKVTGDFMCYNSTLKSFLGAPHLVGGDVNYNSAQVRSLEGVPQFIGGSFGCSCYKLKSLSGIHKRIKRLDDGFYGQRSMTHLLGLLLIPGIKVITVDTGGPIDKIMNKYIGKPNMIIEAQDELIDAGFKEQAKL